MEQGSSCEAVGDGVARVGGDGSSVSCVATGTVREKCRLRQNGALLLGIGNRYSVSSALLNG